VCVRSDLVSSSPRVFKARSFGAMLWEVPQGQGEVPFKLEMVWKWRKGHREWRLGGNDRVGKGLKRDSTTDTCNPVTHNLFVSACWSDIKYRVTYPKPVLSEGPQQCLVVITLITRYYSFSVQTPNHHLRCAHLTHPVKLSFFYAPPRHPF